MDLIESSGRVLEVKFSRKMTEASRMQLLYYLYYIKRRFGVELVGELRFPKERRRMEVCLTAEDIPVIERILKAIREIESMPAPPHAEFTPICTVCAYAELCWG
ncbi:MAG TPA: Dna2/Cas4 domain-containing protein [Armatimonadetes bacterium]|nr:Dna2/Cas4 domain-containing protein [Armatimonadota bacterium]